jgi:hypothetical protein
MHPDENRDQTLSEVREQPFKIGPGSGRSCKMDAGNRFHHTDGRVFQAATELELDQEYLALIFVFCSRHMYRKREWRHEVKSRERTTDD